MGSEHSDESRLRTHGVMIPENETNQLIGGLDVSIPASKVNQLES